MVRAKQMNYLIVHQNFPAQFRHLAKHLAKDGKNNVYAIGSDTARPMESVTLARYSLVFPDLSTVHPFARRFDLECRRAEQIIYIASEFVSAGFVPEVIIVHCGWGESLPLRSLFPKSKIVTYFEFFYRAMGLDVNFDPEWPEMSIDGIIGLRARNAASLLALTETDIAISPTEWQRSTFPVDLQQRIHVCHDGIDVGTARPDSNAQLTLPSGK